MPTPATQTTSSWQRLLLVVSAPLMFLLMSEAAVRVSGIDTDLARNENFEIGVPVWLLDDENWVDIQRGRLSEPEGVRAEDVSWLQHFEEARYIEYKLKPHIEVDANNPFNAIEFEKGTTFRLTSNADGFRTKEFVAKQSGVTRIVTIGDSSTFGWGVDPDYTYQYLLEQRFDRHGGGSTEVLNLGISGHTSRHGRAVFERYVLDLDPDLLIISYGANDARYVLQSADEVLDDDDSWRGHVRSVLYRFETFRLLRRVILSAYDPFDASQARADLEGNERQLVPSVERDTYMENLQFLITAARESGARAALLAVCAPPAYVRGMRYVAETEGVPLVDALELFRDHLEDLRQHRLYADEVRFYEALYGLEAMSEQSHLYVTTDGCHPGRAGHSLIADAFYDALSEEMP